MLFSSSVFLFAYLPIVLVVYYIPLRGLRRAQNLFLLAASLLFYAWGEPWFVLVMAASIAANYGFGLWVHARLCRCRSVRLPVAAAAVCNLGLLFVFKYLTFTLTNLGRLGLSVPVPVIGLPIGISFFTFQAMSYVFDVARGETRVQRSLADLGLYISFFPQLIAGPIVKYSTIAEEDPPPPGELGGFLRRVLPVRGGAGEEGIAGQPVGQHCRRRLGDGRRRPVHALRLAGLAVLYPSDLL